MKLLDKEFVNYKYEQIENLISNQQISLKDKILNYKIILEDIYKELSAPFSNVFLNDLSARIIFISHQYKVNKKISIYATTLNKIAKKALLTSENHIQDVTEKHSIYILCKILGYFSNYQAPENISNLISDVKDEDFIQIETKKLDDQLFDLFGVVEEIEVNQQYSNVVNLVLYNDLYGTIIVNVHNYSANGFGCDLTEIAEIAEKYDKVYITNLKVVDSENKIFSTDVKSIIVLMPDYLIDVKDISECRLFARNVPKGYQDNPYLYLLNKFNMSSTSDSMLLGNVVNQLLDDIVVKLSDGKDYTDEDFKNSFLVSMQNNALSYLITADDLGQYNNSNIRNIYQTAYEQVDTLKNVVKKYQEYNIIIEPTYISNKYGLIGRLDLQVDYDEYTKDIIELKSSKSYPTGSFTLFHNHEAQTYCYDLLLKSAFPNRKGDNYIFYSRAKMNEQPLRYLSTIDRYVQIQDLMMLRNRIVKNELKLAAGDFTSLSMLLTNNEFNFPIYLKDFVTEFRTTLNSLDRLSKKYFASFLKFIFRELVIAKIGDNNSFEKNNGFASLWLDTLQDKISSYDVLTKLKISNIDDDFHITLKFDGNVYENDANVSSFREGDVVLLYAMQDDNTIEPLAQQILKGYVLSIGYDEVIISLYNKQVSINIFTQCEFWCIEKDFRDLSHRQMLQSLYEFMKSDKNVLDIVLGLKKPEFDDDVDLLPNNLDEYQNMNVKKALMAKNYYLIQGPPGTGKTSSVLVEIVKNLITKEKDILIIAYTNRAVDEITNKLVINNVDCIRLGRGDNFYNWEFIVKNNKLYDVYDKVKATKVIVSTLQTFFANFDLIKLKNFGTLIVDEASQILEPQIVGMLKHFDRWILIGDENQLPAVVQQNQQETKCDDDELKQISLNYLCESLFYRLKLNAIKKNWNDCFGMLQYHYRMHNDISEFVSIKFYESKLKVGTEDQKKPIEKNTLPDGIIKELFANNRVVFVGSVKDELPKVNNYEADLIAKIVDYVGKWYGDDFDIQKSIGVITPFKAQIVNIRNRLDKKYQAITIDTIERYQGSERDIIIFSLAVNNIYQIKRLQQINELNVDRKLNVALTRAKYHLIVTGVEEILSKVTIYRDWISYTKSNGGYFKDINFLLMS